MARPEEVPRARRRGLGGARIWSGADLFAGSFGADWGAGWPGNPPHHQPVRGGGGGRRALNGGRDDGFRPTVATVVAGGGGEGFGRPTDRPTDSSSGF